MTNKYLEQLVRGALAVVYERWGADVLDDICLDAINGEAVNLNQIGKKYLFFGQAFSQKRLLEAREKCRSS